VTRTPEEQAEYERAKGELIERSERRQGRWVRWAVLLAVLCPIVCWAVFLGVPLVPLGNERTPGAIGVGMVLVGVSAVAGRLTTIGLIASVVAIVARRRRLLSPLTPVLALAAAADVALIVRVFAP
jgi:hypothetical protein